MPWITPEPKPACEHKDQPTPRIMDADRVWECPNCREWFKVYVVDLGHDVMPGERRVYAEFRPSSREDLRR